MLTLKSWSPSHADDASLTAQDAATRVGQREPPAIDQRYRGEHADERRDERCAEKVFPRLPWLQPPPGRPDPGHRLCGRQGGAHHEAGCSSVNLAVSIRRYSACRDRPASVRGLGYDTLGALQRLFDGAAVQCRLIGRRLHRDDRENERRTPRSFCWMTAGTARESCSAVPGHYPATGGVRARSMHPGECEPGPREVTGQPLRCPRADLLTPESPTR